VEAVQEDVTAAQRHYIGKSQAHLRDVVDEAMAGLVCVSHSIMR
jgi:hypothetical protein